MQRVCIGLYSGGAFYGIMPNIDFYKVVKRRGGGGRLGRKRLTFVLFPKRAGHEDSRNDEN